MYPRASSASCRQSRAISYLLLPYGCDPPSALRLLDEAVGLWLWEAIPVAAPVVLACKATAARGVAASGTADSHGGQARASTRRQSSRERLGMKAAAGRETGEVEQGAAQRRGSAAGGRTAELRNFARVLASSLGD